MRCPSLNTANTLQENLIFHCCNADHRSGKSSNSASSIISMAPGCKTRLAPRKVSWLDDSKKTRQAQVSLVGLPPSIKHRRNANTRRMTRLRSSMISLPRSQKRRARNRRFSLRIETHAVVLEDSIRRCERRVEMIYAICRLRLQHVIPCEAMTGMSALYKRWNPHYTE